MTTNNDDLYDATNPTGATQLPAVMTHMNPAQFKQWLAEDGELFCVYLPMRKSFVLKVPTEHNAFFVAMMQQIRFALGPDVQAIRMTVVTGPPADVDAGTAASAPDWAQPPQRHDDPAEHALETIRKIWDSDHCPGSGTASHNPDGAGRGSEHGSCSVCFHRYKLTYERTLPRHKARP